jgi:metal-responsive CopG/Arc/MetJ family transcriptional regulator
MRNKSVPAKPPASKFCISFPEQMKKQLDRLAKRESRSTSELLREAFRVYLATKK